MDADELRDELHDRWERSAGGWARRERELRAFGLPVARWLIDALAPQPGQRLLELAAGTGDVGLLAAELLRPGGTLVMSDFSEEMLAVARERAAQEGASEIEFRELALEWIDLPAASVDGILCRWGLMFAVDPEAALREMRRVLRPGGRLALAVWDGPQHNPWAQLSDRALEAVGVAAVAQQGGPGIFALADEPRLRELLESAGFTEIETGVVAVERRHADAAEAWEVAADLSQPFAQALARMDAPARAAAREALGRAAAEFAGPDGAIVLPGRSLVASATA